MGLFITIEGPDGAGKTTQLNLLKGSPESANWVFTRNPGGTSFGAKLREILLNDKEISLHSTAELLLYMADRAQHVQEIVQPALMQRKIVICDRFSDSTVAYQGYGRGLNLQIIDELNRIATQGLKPDLTFLLDIDPEIGLQRAKSNDKMEAEGINFQKMVRAGFLNLASDEPGRFKVIDTSSLGIKKVHQIILETIHEKLKEKNIQSPVE